MGAVAIPVSRLRLSSMITTSITQTNVIRMPNRRAIEPSAVGFISNQ